MVAWLTDEHLVVLEQRHEELGDAHLRGGVRSRVRSGVGHGMGVGVGVGVGVAVAVAVKNGVG